MTYNGYITTIKNVRPHANANKMKLGDCFGNTVCIDLSFVEGQKGLYLPVDGQVSEEFGKQNNLLRLKDEQGNNVGGYLDPEKRNIKAISLRGEKSDGIFLPIGCLNYCFEDGNADAHLNVGDAITIVNGHEICQKYIPKSKPRVHSASGNQKRKKKKRNENEPIFPEHIDTSQLKFCLKAFKPGDLITITEKLEGTSHRSALLPVVKKGWLRRLLKRPEKVVYKDYCGSRRVTINQEKTKDGFYGSNGFRVAVHKKIAPHLTPNMEVFAEIVGWPGEGMAPLMGEVDTKCLKDKNFTKKYGEKMVFHYGCADGTYDFYIYRICELDVDGSVRLEYSTDQVMAWCEEHGFKYVPVLWRGFIPGEEMTDPGEFIMDLAEKHCDGESTLAHHWREGCVVRRDNNARKFDVYKNKNFFYKTMKGMFVENVNTDGMSQDILEEM